MCILSLGQEDALEEEMATHPVFLPGKSQERGSWQATVHGVAKSRTQLSEHTRIGRGERAGKQSFSGISAEIIGYPGHLTQNTTLISESCINKL